MLQYASAFTRVFCNRYPHRRAPFLTAKNEPGTPKLVRLAAAVHTPELAEPALGAFCMACAGVHLAAADGHAARGAAAAGGHLQVRSRVCRVRGVGRIQS